MEPLTLGQLADATGGAVERGRADLLIRDITTDSRGECAGAFFVPLEGEKFDGHKFIADTARKGAIGCAAANGKSLGRARLPGDFAVLRVENTLRAYQDMGAAARKTLRAPVAAITGSCGKTTTKNMMRNVLARRWRVVATEKNENNEIGVPKTLLRAGADTGAVVLEMGMRGPGQIRELARIATPDIAVITNVEKTHIGELGSAEAIAAAKGELIEEAPQGSPVFLNADNPWTLWLAKRTRAAVVTFGINSGHLRATDISCDFNGISFRVHGAGQPWHVRLPLLGRANVYNALAVISVALYLRMSVEEIKAGLFQDIAEQGRMRRIQTPGGSVIIDDTYNSNPTSLSFALQMLGELPWGGRRVAVLADMLELGEYSRQEHFDIGNKLVDGNCDLLIAIGPEAAQIAEGALESGMPGDMVVAVETIPLLKRRMGALFLPGDLILVKGSRGMHLEKVVEMLTGGKI
jgi:UDP-N-acetylmuramoyl-tripeptide--D-alanyl-D-alanine ligase